jgi:glycosyltransferase involved in cell wall biosynthesis
MIGQKGNIRVRSLSDESYKMRRPTKNFSIILGCYNAGASLETNLVDLTSLLDSLERSYELLIVEDGSQDDSLKILRRLEKGMPNLVILRNPKNMGKGFSIRNGVLNSRGNNIVFTDLDMAYSKQNMLTVLDKLEGGCPIVVGNRRLPESMYTAKNTLVKYVHRRHRIGIAFNSLVRRLFDLTTRDTQSGLKGFQRHVAVQIFNNLYTDGFLFDVEMFIRAKKLGIKIVEIPVHLSYHTDESTINHFRQFFTILPQLLHIKILELKGAYSTPVSREQPSPQDDGLNSRERVKEQVM